MAKRRARSFVGSATFIQKSREKSAEEKAVWNDEDRNFFGLNDEDGAAIQARIEAGIEQALKDEHP